MDNKYNLVQKAKRLERNELRTTIRIPNELLTRIKIKAFEQRLSINSFMLNLFRLAINNISIQNDEVKNLYHAGNYEDLRTQQIIFPRELQSGIKIMTVLLEDQKCYDEKIAGLQRRGRCLIDILYSGLVFQEHQNTEK